MYMINNDIKKELFKSAGKSLLQVPVLSFLADAIEVHGKVKQQRAIEFLTDFAEYLQVEHVMGIKHKRLGSEEFADLLDEALQNVSTTSSRKKAKLFKEVLTAHLISETEPKITDIYLKIIGRITEKQILILAGLARPSETDYIYLHEQIHRIETEIRTLEAENKRELGYIKDNSQVAGRNKMVADKKKEVAGLKEQAAQNKWHRFETYGCEENEYHFLLHDLFNNGLVTDMGTSIGADPFRVVEINQMGKDILTFLNADQPSNSTNPSL